MSTQIKNSYEIGEIVLCFEPDPTKARVLYDAKVLRITSSEEKGKQRVGFEVHFQGWNSSWDRVVPESFILKNTTANRKLMKKLADIARRTRKNSTRKRKIDLILKKHFYHTPKLYSSDSSEIDSGSEDIYLSDLDESNNESDDDKIKDDSSHMLDDPPTGEESLDENEEHDDGLGFEVGPVDIEIPKILQHILEDDMENIFSQNKLLRLPTEPNLITILEAYAKNFAINVMYATSDKLRSRDTFPPPPERNIDFVKEMLDSLRIMFDVYLPTILLYGCEQNRYKEFSSAVNPPWIKREESMDSSLMQPQKINFSSNSDCQEPPVTKRRRTTIDTNKSLNEDDGSENSLIISNSHSVHPMSNSSSRCSTPSLQEVSSMHDKEGALNGVLSWRIIPSEEYYLTSPIPASIIYGMHHLLRLLVKLPDIISRMPIPATSLKPLLKHVTLFINYLSEHSEEFLCQATYDDISTCTDAVVHYS